MFYILWLHKQLFISRKLIAMDDSDSDLIEYRSGKNKAGAMSNQKNSKSKVTSIFSRL
jgi:hypothetical protein